MLRQTILRVWLGLALLAVAIVANAESRGISKEYKLKSAYLFNFSRFAQWPAASFASPQSAVQLCVRADLAASEPVNSDAFLAFLKELVGMRRVGIGQRLVEVKQLLDDSAGEGCHMLYVLCKQCGYQLSPFAMVVANRQYGLPAMIAFYPQAGRVRFEVSLSALKKTDIKLSSELLKLARKVK